MICILVFYVPAESALLEQITFVQILTVIVTFTSVLPVNATLTLIGLIKGH
ncbi:hypothetical protein [Bacillus sp. AFS055030]|uniref:hypothetical protein n=1 Tax=Bacillus sp. AFS055030 TaxID=2033507 RepID=UPI0015D4F778|nr:hypothetical protein [Bacillus sp. AFS055030]